MTYHLQAGRELDAAVAEKVMRWVPYSGGYYYGVPGGAPMTMVCMAPGDGAAPHWSPSTEMGAAWEVAETRPAGRRWALTPAGDDEEGRPLWCAMFGPSNWAVCASAPEAICRAALKAVDTCIP